VTTESALYRDLAYVFAAAFIGGLAARRLRQPLIVGYVIAGIAIGPFTPGPRVVEVQSLERLAELGVVLLMYSIGIEFSVAELMKEKWAALLGGPAGIALSIGLAMGIGRLLGWPLQQGFVVGAAVSVASTMVMARLLLDTGELKSAAGRLMIGVTLVEDLAVVLLTVLLPEASTLGGGHLGPFALDLAKGLALLILLIAAAHKLVPPLMRVVARSGSAEISLMVELSVGLATAAASQALGLSLALGAFLGGIAVSGTEFAQETLERVRPLRDAFGALFFVTVGTLINPGGLLSRFGIFLLISAMIVFGKLAVWTAVLGIFRYPFKTVLRAAVGLTQIGEFSYVLVAIGRREGLIDEGVYNAVLGASLFSILANVALTRFTAAREAA
jgi:CPA2 family monovalent cation:H+ antiporter-2